ncbi:hypothetical protein CLV84_1645 [Neolewinella xylanilytica]|uniref:Dicarboxylate transport n=1 Tax=Neolewinella xylanilytica TaxID=1514080 RepID=A0A2S6IB15_9BACT|nr:hypothetical protein [Neolewinella xylanilytica]PPK88675.1 hypothetical protein CLV84_1645 [Neolewinella xylanilytica]
MSVRPFRLHWWYLFFLLPVALYLGARWYIDHRIDQAIASANEGGNQLTVGEYSYGLFPLRLEARQVNFDQERANFSARGRLSTVAVDRLHLFSLFGSDPIEIELLRLHGLDADLRRTGSGNSNDSSSFALELVEVELDSIYLDFTDDVSGREVQLVDLGLSVQSLHFPLRPAEIRSLQLSADSTVYANTTNDLRIVASGIGYGTGSESVAIAALTLRRGSETDIRAEDLVLSGLNAGDLSETVSVDSFSIGSLGGSAQVPATSGNSRDTSQTSPLRVGTIRFPQIDLELSGDFGTASYAGGVTASGLRYRDSLSLERVSVDSDSLSFDNQKGLAVILRQLELQQQGLQFPLAAGELGATELVLPSFTVMLDKQTISGENLNYRSASGEATVENVQVEGDKVNGSTDKLTVAGIDRAAVLGDRPAVLESAVLDGARAAVYRADGGHYEFSVPQITLNDVQVQPPISAGRARLENATFSRYGSDGRKDMQGEGLYVDQRDIPVPFEPEALGEGNVRMRELRLIGSEELPVDYYFSQIAYDSRAALLTMDSLQRQTRVSKAELFERELAKTHMDFSFDDLRMAGIRRDGLLRGEVMHIDSLAASDFRLRVVESLAIEVSGNERPMPVEALRKLGMRIVLNKARFRSTDIAYGVVDSVMDAKTIHFTDGVIVLEDLDTEICRSDSVLAIIDATFEETTPLHAEFRLSRREPGRGYSARGELGTYDLARVNPLMRVAAGAVIEEGVIEKLTYDARMHQDTIRGTLTMLYRDLNVKLVDGGLSWLKNLLSGVVVKDGNSRGEEFRLGEIYHEHQPIRSFFNSYWKGLVSGMKSTALSDIALPEELD